MFNAMKEEDDQPKTNAPVSTEHDDSAPSVADNASTSKHESTVTVDKTTSADSISEKDLEREFDLFEDDEAWLRNSTQKSTRQSTQDVDTGNADDTATAENDGDGGGTDKSADFVISEEDDAAVIKQEEGLLTWQILGVYNDEGKTHRGIYLRENPPILLMESSQGEEVSIVLTRDLTRTLSTTFKDLNRAYHGHRRTRGESRGILDGDTPVEWFKKHPVRSGVTAVIAFMFFLVLMFSLFGG